MSKEIIADYKKEDHKYKKGFIIFMICCFVAGNGSGIVIAYGEDMLIKASVIASDGLKAMSIYANLILALISMIVTVILFRQIQNMYSKWDGENEEVINLIERKCSYVIVISSINQIILFIFMAIGFLRLEDLRKDNASLIIKVVIFIIGIIFSEIYVIVAQNKTINFEKKLNPEKQGSVYDLKFQKKWMGSFDEAERMMTYEAAFEAYKAVQTTCMILWIVCIIGMTVWDFGVVPVCMIGIIWMVSTLSYSIKAIKLENK